MKDLEILKDLKKAKSRIYRIKQKGLYSDAEKLFKEQLFMENIDSVKEIYQRLKQMKFKHYVKKYYLL